MGYLLAPIKSETGSPGLAGGGKSSSLWGASNFSYCPRKVPLQPSPGTLLFLYKFPCGTLIGSSRAWILLCTQGALGVVPMIPGNQYFPSHSCGAYQSSTSSDALSFLAGDIYLGEGLIGQFIISTRSLQKITSRWKDTLGVSGGSIIFFMIRMTSKIM